MAILTYSKLNTHQKKIMKIKKRMHDEGIKSEDEYVEYSAQECFMIDESLVNKIMENSNYLFNEIKEFLMDDANIYEGELSISEVEANKTATEVSDRYLKYKNIIEFVSDLRKNANAYSSNSRLLNTGINSIMMDIVGLKEWYDKNDQRSIDAYHASILERFDSEEHITEAKARAEICELLRQQFEKHYEISLDVNIMKTIAYIISMAAIWGGITQESGHYVLEDADVYGCFSSNDVEIISDACYAHVITAIDGHTYPEHHHYPTAYGRIIHSALIITEHAEIEEFYVVQ